MTSLDRRLRAAAAGSPIRSISTCHELTSRSLRFHWMKRAGAFLAGQATVRLINLCVGLLLVHVLPVDQYALYTVAAALLAILVMGSDLGISTAIITQGARAAGDRCALGGLFKAGMTLCRRLFGMALLIFLGAATVMLSSQSWSLPVKVVVISIVGCTGWLRVRTVIAQAILHLQHDSAGLFRVGAGEAITRLILVSICFTWPHAGVALLIGLAGASIARWASDLRIGPSIERSAVPTEAQHAAIRAFVIPLAPMIAYTALQGHIAVLILSFYGSTESIAAVGAVTRLNQIISIGLLLNPFLIQPIMARQTSRFQFLRRIALILSGLWIVSTLAMTSAHIMPGWWLWILGESYAGLDRELVVTVATALLILIGGTLYTVVVSQNRTAGQFWPILPSVLGQVAFVAVHGVADAFDALLLGLIPALAYATIQGVLLVKVVRDWPAHREAPA